MIASEEQKQLIILIDSMINQKVQPIIEQFDILSKRVDQVSSENRRLRQEINSIRQTQQHHNQSMY